VGREPGGYSSRSCAQDVPACWAARCLGRADRQLAAFLRDYEIFSNPPVPALSQQSEQARTVVAPSELFIRGAFEEIEVILRAALMRRHAAHASDNCSGSSGIGGTAENADLLTSNRTLFEVHMTHPIDRYVEPKSACIHWFGKAYCSGSGYRSTPRNHCKQAKNPSRPTVKDSAKISASGTCDYRSLNSVNTARSPSRSPITLPRGSILEPALE
jgi:hypothetical protein